MKNFLCLSFLLIIIHSASCKKAIENKQKDLLIDAMTNGQWIVQQYIEVTNDITIQFNGYSFQFEANGAVHGIKDSIILDGTWQGDINNYSISSQFPTASDPVKKLNGVWKLTDSDWKNVKAEMHTSSGKNFLRLLKKP